MNVVSVVVLNYLVSLTVYFLKEVLQNVVLIIELIIFHISLAYPHQNFFFPSFKIRKFTSFGNLNFSLLNLL